MSARLRRRAEMRRHTGEMAGAILALDLLTELQARAVRTRPGTLNVRLISRFLKRAKRAGPAAERGFVEMVERLAAARRSITAAGNAGRPS